jgi:hypothetical protein
LVIVPISSETEDKFEDAMEVTASSPLFELARVLVRLDHVAVIIVNADHGIMRATAKLCCGASLGVVVPAQKDKLSLRNHPPTPPATSMAVPVR